MNHPINDPFEYWRVLLYLVFLDHLVTEISSRVIKNEARFSGACLVPNKLHTLTDQTTNSIFDSFRTSGVQIIGNIDYSVRRHHTIR